MARKICFGAILASFLLTTAAWPCDVPVFRFALERWYPDVYRLGVTPGKNGALSPDEVLLVEALSKAGEPEEMCANLVVSAPAKEAADTVSARFELRYPQRLWGAPESPAFWNGEATRENAKRILESPLRRELAKRLLSGESAVWVLVESGKPDADQKAEEALQSAFAEVKKEMQISDAVVSRDAIEKGMASVPFDPENVLHAPVPLKIDFSVLRLSHSDPAEQVFLAMLLHLEADLPKLAGQPMAFPVFGRGRVLEPLIGAGIHRDNVIDYSAYLCGACSCQVKEQNPGMDLLVSVDWESAIDGSEVVIDKVLPPLEGVASLLGEVPAPQAAIPPAPKPSSPEKPRSTPVLRFPLILAATLGAALLAIALGTVVLLLRANRGR